MFVCFPTFFLCTPVSHCLITPCVFKPVLFPRSLLVRLFPHINSAFILRLFFEVAFFVACFLDFGFLVTSIEARLIFHLPAYFGVCVLCVFVSVFAKPDRFCIIYKTLAQQ